MLQEEGRSGSRKARKKEKKPKRKTVLKKKKKKRDWISRYASSFTPWALTRQQPSKTRAPGPPGYWHPLPKPCFHTSKLKCFCPASYLPLWNAQCQALLAFGNYNNDSGDCKWRMEELIQVTGRLVLAYSSWDNPCYSRWGPQNLQDVGLASPCRMLFPQVILPQKIPTLSKVPISGSHCRLTFHSKKS